MPMGKVAGKRITIISPEPNIAKVLRSWQPVLPRPLREIWLQWIEDIEMTLRAREFWVGLISTEIAATIYNAIKNPIVKKISNLLGREIRIGRR